MYGSYVNQPYTRPKRLEKNRPDQQRLLRDIAKETRHRPMRGQEYHMVPIAAIRARPTMELELVPEPGNPWDGNAIAIDFDGKRIGYFPAELAPSWQGAVRNLRRKGVALYLPATVTDENNPRVILEIPRLQVVEVLLAEFGFGDDLPSDIKRSNAGSATRSSCSRP